MGFFDMGPLEILLILIVALIIWGPNRIPEIARTLGRMVYTLRKSTNDITSAVTREILVDEKDRQTPTAKGQNKTGVPLEPPDTDKTDPGDKESSPPERPMTNSQ